MGHPAGHASATTSLQSYAQREGVACELANRVTVGLTGKFPIAVDDGRAPPCAGSITIDDVKLYR
jgi:hypothetical protein